MAGFTAQQRMEMAGSGQAMMSGAFPIANRADLENAIRAVGRVQPDTDEARNAVRRFCMKRARELGLMDMIPDNWNADGSLKTP